MAQLPKPLQALIEAFRKFPGVGEKSAQRFAFHLLQQPAEETVKLAEMIKQLPQHVVRCDTCGLVDDANPCRYDRDQSRDRSTICIVAETPDVSVIEQSGEYKGLYHVLGGVLNPLSGVTPEQLRIEPLVQRVKQGQIKEVIIATNPDMEGETTALHLKRVLSRLNIKITRLGRGLPMGATLEYADEVTVANALKGRQSL